MGVEQWEEGEEGDVKAQEGCQRDKCRWVEGRAEEEGQESEWKRRESYGEDEREECGLLFGDNVSINRDLNFHVR